MVIFGMASGPFVEMSFSDYERHRPKLDEIPLICFIPTEQVRRECVSMSIYNSSGNKNLTFDVQVFDGTGDTEDIIHWWQGVIKYFLLAKITDPKDNFEAVPIFLATKGALPILWTNSRKSIALVKRNLGTR